MNGQTLTINRLIFLFVLVTVFVFTYVADLNIFAAILRAISYASPYVGHFSVLFLILSFTSLSVYYYLSKKTPNEVSQRFLVWLRVFCISFSVGFLISVLIIYLNIYAIKTFDVI